MTLSVLYRQAVPPPGWGTSIGCTHHYSPSDLRIQTDWSGTSTRLEPAGDRLFQATIADAPPGEHWLRFVVSINGVVLTRIAQLPVPGAALPVPSLLFTVSADGTVRP